MPAIPPTKAILKRFEPNIFPKSIVYSFFLVREIEAASSGKLVPIATSVNPISSSGTPARDARFLAPKTSESEPTHNAEVAIKIINIDNGILFSFVSLFDDLLLTNFEFLFNNALRVIKIK